MHLQITTEAIGIYSPEQMRNLIYNVDTPGISIGIKEMILGIQQMKILKFINI